MVRPPASFSQQVNHGLVSYRSMSMLAPSSGSSSRCSQVPRVFDLVRTSLWELRRQCCDSPRWLSQTQAHALIQHGNGHSVMGVVRIQEVATISTARVLEPTVLDGQSLDMNERCTGTQRTASHLWLARTPSTKDSLRYSFPSPAPLLPC